MKSLRHLSLLVLWLVTVSSHMARADTVAEAPRKRIAILLFDGADVIDFSAPYDVFVNARMDVFTVSPEGKPITTEGGMNVVPGYSYANAPDADAVLIPGGNIRSVQHDLATMAWIKQRYGRGEYLMSVCNGAFTLANTGLLKGLKATTTSGNIDALRRSHADLDVVRNVRVVDNGRLITTGGLSAGIDGALHLVSRLEGMGRAQFVAEVMEYNWQPEGSFLPAMHAFRVMHQTLGDENLVGVGHIEALVSTTGDNNHWSYVWHVESSLDSFVLANRIDQTLAEERKEMKMNPPYSASPGHNWAFVDNDGQLWNERLEVSAIAGEQHLHTVKLSIIKKLQ